MSLSMTLAMTQTSAMSWSEMVQNYQITVDQSPSPETTEDTIIFGFSDVESLEGGQGDDLFVLTVPVDRVDGGDGHDAIILPWSIHHSDFSFDEGEVIVRSGDTEVALSQIELVTFNDATVALHEVIHDLNNGAEIAAPTSIFQQAWKYLPSIDENGAFDWSDLDASAEMPMSGHAHHEAAVLNLVPISEATIVAVKSGDWSDPSIWSEGRPPGPDDKVFIPQHAHVTVDGVFSDPVFTVRVDGKLSFDTEVETGITVDTLVVASTGALEIGTPDFPVDQDASTHILIADNGPIDQNWDPEQISRGIVAMGTVTIHGEEMTTHSKVADAPSEGDTFLTLVDAPLNWSVGDNIVITGTEFVPKLYNPETGEYDIYQGTQDEVRVITRVDGNQVWFDEPLGYDHHVPADGLAASVANLSRSIVVETENADVLPANQRGHIMFMHNDDVDVRYMQAMELGRTDRSTGMDDYETFVMSNEWNSEGRVRDADGNWIEGESTNIRGRYAIHFHMAGVETDDEPGYLVGNSVWGSPGWGYVQHDSYAVFEDNVAFDVFGSAFVAETGNEVGRWQNNLAIAGEGRNEYIKWGTYNMDLGGEGYGFWMNGRSIDLIDNIATGMSEGGFAWFSRGIDMIETDADNLIYSELSRGLDSIHDEYLPLGTVTGNEVYASDVGFFSVRGIKLSSQQINDSRSVISDFAAWDVQQGFHLEYSSSYTIKDGILISAEVNDPDTGAHQSRSAGFNILRNFEDMVVEDVSIEGFDTGIFHIYGTTITQARLNDGFTFQDENGWGLRFIDVDIDAKRDFNATINQSVSVVDKADIMSYELGLDIDEETLFARWTSTEERFLDPLTPSQGIVLEGIKYDSLGRVEFPDGNERIFYTVEQVNTLLTQDGFFTDEDGDKFIMINELITDRRTADAKIETFFVEIDPDWEIPEDAFDNGLDFSMMTNPDYMAPEHIM